MRRDRKRRRFEEKLSHLRKQAAFKAEANAGELDAVRAAIAENEQQWNEVRPTPRARVNRPCSCELPGARTRIILWRH